MRRCARPNQPPAGPSSPRTARFIPSMTAYRAARGVSRDSRHAWWARSSSAAYSSIRPAIDAAIAASSRSSIPSRVSRSAAENASKASSQSHLAYASRPSSSSMASAYSRYSRPMAVTPETQSWARLFAARTRGDVGEGIAAILSLLGVPNLISFAGGLPDPQTFPRERAAKLLAEFAAAGEVSAFQYTPTRGLSGTLDAIAGRLEQLQGRRPAVDELGRRLAGGLRPKLFYTIPDHQNPAGISLTGERRELLVELARRHGFVIVEDVAYRELSFEGDALPSLWSLAPDVVVQAGTTSKTFLPGVRLGWGVGPAEIAAQLISAKQNTDQCAGALGQRLFEEYVRRGWIDEQLARSRALYRRKAQRMLDALERCMPSGTTWTRPRGGFFSWLTLPGVDAAELAKRAVEQGVGIVPGSPFFPDGRGTDNVRLSFSMVDEELIDDGIERLASLV